jgi:hypothetical membrane protein
LVSELCCLTQSCRERLGVADGGSGIGELDELGYPHDRVARARADDQPFVRDLYSAITPTRGCFRLVGVTSTRANSTNLAALWLTAALVFFISEAIAAASIAAPHRYSYASDYISQLGVPGWTPLAVVMNVGLYVQGVLFLVGAVLAARASATGRRRVFLVLAALYSLGTILVAAVPFGVGAPASNLLGLHWLGALLAIFAGNAAIVAGSSVVAGLVGVRWYRKTSVVLAVLGFVSFLILGQPAARPSLGIWERGSVYSIMLWQIFSAVLLLARRSRRSTKAPTRFSVS